MLFIQNLDLFLKHFTLSVNLIYLSRAFSPVRYPGEVEFRMRKRTIIDNVLWHLRLFCEGTLIVWTIKCSPLFTSWLLFLFFCEFPHTSTFEGVFMCPWPRVWYKSEKMIWKYMLLNQNYFKDSSQYVRTKWNLKSNANINTVTIYVVLKSFWARKVAEVIQENIEMKVGIIHCKWFQRLVNEWF